MGLYSNPLFTGVFGPLTGTTSVNETPTQSAPIAAEQNGALGVLNGMLNPATDPTLAPVKAAATDQINRNYAALPNQLTAQMSARGFGSSGKVGGGLLGIDSSRLGDLSGLMGQMAQLGSQRQMNALSIIQEILRNNTGRSTVATKGSLSGLSAIQSLLKMLQNGGKSPDVALPSLPYRPPSINPSGTGYGGTSGGDVSMPSMDYQDYNDGLPSQSYQPSNGTTSTVSYPSDPSYNPTYGDEPYDPYTPGWGDNGYGDEE